MALFPLALSCTSPFRLAHGFRISTKIFNLSRPSPVQSKRASRDSTEHQPLCNRLRRIRRFRYLNHQAILATLEKFYFWRRRHTLPASPPSTPTPVTSTAGDGASTVVVKHLAEDKLNEAACIDNLLKDT
jgi:hypothetical protein